jgi:Fe2+ or Zn2+ uptake regulation protein
VRRAINEFAMGDAAKRERVRLFERLCREHGLRATVQRRVILETVLDLDNHPTADQVYAMVVERLPGVSRTTVYRALDSLARLGVITKACHPGAVARYDRRTELHHHLICLHCDGIVDISDARLDDVEIPDTSAYGFEVSDIRVQLRGLCRQCRANVGKEKAK